MKKFICIVAVGAFFLIVLLPGIASAGEILGPFGNGYWNTPVAWNASSGVHVSGFSWFGSDAMDGWGGIFDYSSGAFELAGFGQSFTDTDVNSFGGTLRYTAFTFPAGMKVTLLGQASSLSDTDVDVTGWQAGAVVGQQLPAGVSYSIYAGFVQTKADSDKESDTAAGVNFSVGISPQTSFFAEALRLFDAEETDWSAGIIYSLPAGLKVAGGVTGTSNGDSDTAGFVSVVYSFGVGGR